MKAVVRITVLADNTVVARDARGEHGLAFWIDSPGAHLLFDTGQGLVLADNARALRVDLRTVDAVVLSHGHYDHTGGLAGILRDTKAPVTVHAHPTALLPRYRVGESTRDIGMSAACREAVLGERCRLSPSRRPVEVAPGVWTTGEIPRRHPEEAVDEPFCMDPKGHAADLLPDDQALFIHTEQGMVVLLGCAHSGVINTLDHVQELSAGKPVRAVMGGMHLGSATAERLAWTIRELRRFESRLLAPLHCTGPKAAARLWGDFPDACRAGGVGSQFEF
jgi:7,8-dihydropterin-6-yl-methyl-4-(beta-D-ribofuranosyl)aminobenzene 5'-phosphate synthase